MIHLESKIQDEINVRLNGVSKYTAYQVAREKKKAVQIVNLLEREFKNE